MPGPGVDRDLGGATGDGIRVDSGYGPGNTVTPNYDSLMAKSSSRRGPGRGAGPGARGGGRLPDRRPEEQPAVLRRTAGQRGVRVRRLRHRRSCPGCDEREVHMDSSDVIQAERDSLREVGPRDGLQNEEPMPPMPRYDCSTRCPAPACGGSRRSASCTPRRSRRWPTPRRCGLRAAKVDGVRYSALVPNSRGAQRALAAGFRSSRWWCRPVEHAQPAQRQPSYGRVTGRHRRA